jgi:hypothetical protein
MNAELESKDVRKKERESREREKSGGRERRE